MSLCNWATEHTQRDWVPEWMNAHYMLYVWNWRSPTFEWLNGTFCLMRVLPSQLFHFQPEVPGWNDLDMWQLEKWLNGLPGWHTVRDGVSVGLCLWFPLWAWSSASHSLSHNPLLRISLIFSAYSICVASQSPPQLRILPYCPSKGHFWKSYQTNEEQKHTHETNPFDLEEK